MTCARGGAEAFCRLGCFLPAEVLAPRPENAGRPGGMVALSNRDRVGRALDMLARGLVPVVDRCMAAFLPSGRDWLEAMIGRARRNVRPATMVRSDPRLLLRVIEENPRAFRDALSKLDLAFALEIRE